MIPALAVGLLAFAVYGNFFPVTYPAVTGPRDRGRMLRGGPGLGGPGTAPHGRPGAGRTAAELAGSAADGSGAAVTAARPARLLFAGRPIRPVTGPDLPEAVAVAGDTLLEIGSLADCRDALGRGHQEVDLAGATLIPGFVDAHCHPLMLGQTSTWVDVSPARAPDIPAIIKLLRQHATLLPPGTPLRAYGYNHRALPERRHPTAADLDQAATDREIYVMNQSGHGGVLNTAGLARCGITASTPDLTGGHIGRHADGRPDGLIMDAACDLLTGADGVKLGRHGPNLHLPPAPGEAARWLDNAQRAFLAAGVTSLVDAQSAGASSPPTPQPWPQAGSRSGSACG